MTHQTFRVDGREVNAATMRALRDKKKDVALSNNTTTGEAGKKTKPVKKTKKDKKTGTILDAKKTETVVADKEIKSGEAVKTVGTDKETGAKKIEPVKKEEKKDETKKAEVKKVK